MGPQGVPGPVGLTFQGVYSSVVNYALGDGVSYNGADYVSLQASNHGNTPGQMPTFWTLFAQNGAPGAAGVPGLTWQGTYASTTNYALNDAVAWQGSSYVSLIASNRGNTPGVNPEDWSLLAAQGAAGAAGSAGATGATGATGANGTPGTNGTNGATGAAGAVGMTFKGAWAPSYGYATNDAVTFGGSTYIATVGNNSQEPDTNSGNGGVWSLLAQGSIGPAGPTGPTGQSTTVTVGTTTTGLPGSSASVTTSGNSSALVLNFTIPQGAAGSGGRGGGGGIPYMSTYHSVSFAYLYYSVNGITSSGSQSSSILTWIPSACNAPTLNVYSQQTNTITVALSVGSTPSTVTDSTLMCSAAPNGSGGTCPATGVTIDAGSFVDLHISGANGTAAGVWTALTCN
jgi:hypothetical protein